MDTKQLIETRKAIAEGQLQMITNLLEEIKDAQLSGGVAKDVYLRAKAAANACRDIANVARVLERPYEHA